MSQELSRLFIVMGVSGCGKSSIGKALASRFSGTYLEGDDLHPAANIELMSAGTPLTDKDRWPWLENVAKAMAVKKGVVFTGCSALKKSYRSFLIEKAGEQIFFIHLAGTKQLIADRMSKRSGHFMPVKLLDSQFATLEPPGPSETALTTDISETPDKILQHIVLSLEQDNSVTTESNPKKLQTQI